MGELQPPTVLHDLDREAAEREVRALSLGESVTRAFRSALESRS